jgi:hypothetical protein
MFYNNYFMFYINYFSFYEKIKGAVAGPPVSGVARGREGA